MKKQLAMLHDKLHMTKAMQSKAMFKRSAQIFFIKSKKQPLFPQFFCLTFS